jgi:GH15 family glucan-1,4-alpha-glucosidase
MKTKFVLPSGVLAKQVHPFTEDPLSVSPLTWSHAAFVSAVQAYLKAGDSSYWTHLLNLVSKGITKRSSK